jgi:hypothetical protein
MCLLCEIWVSHSCGDENPSLLAYDTLQSSIFLISGFRRDIEICALLGY